MPLTRDRSRHDGCGPWSDLRSQSVSWIHDQRFGRTLSTAMNLGHRHLVKRAGGPPRVRAVLWQGAWCYDNGVIYGDRRHSAVFAHGFGSGSRKRALAEAEVAHTSLPAPTLHSVHDESGRDLVLLLLRALSGGCWSNFRGWSFKFRLLSRKMSDGKSESFVATFAKFLKWLKSFIAFEYFFTLIKFRN